MKFCLVTTLIFLTFATQARDTVVLCKSESASLEARFNLAKETYGIKSYGDISLDGLPTYGELKFHRNPHTPNVLEGGRYRWSPEQAPMLTPELQTFARLQVGKGPVSEFDFGAISETDLMINDLDCRLENHSPIVAAGGIGFEFN